MHEYRPDIFVSATSRDLATYRKLVAEELSTAGYFPVIQDYFGPDHRKLIRLLEDKVAGSQAVICLVGCVYGAEPDDVDANRRSYTQMEYDTARRLGKRIYVLLAENDTVSDQTVQEDPERRALQEDHRRTLMCDAKVEFFASHQALREHVLRIIPKLPAARLQPRWVHLPKEPAYFAGRRYELDQLSKLRDDRKSCVIVVIGLGGQGKTTMVAHWVRGQEVESPGRFYGTFWCTAMLGGFTFDQFLDDLLEYFLGESYDKQSYPGLHDRSKKVIQIMSERRTLVVIDGLERWIVRPEDVSGAFTILDTVEQRTSCVEGLDEFLSQATAITSGSHLILTSRALPAVLDDALCSVVPVYEEGKEPVLDGLDPDSVVDLFEQSGVKGTREEMIAAAAPHANHPLALTVLAGLLTKKYGGDLSRAPDLSPLDKRRALYHLFEDMREGLPGGPRAERVLQLASHCLENPSVALLAWLYARLGPGSAEYEDIHHDAVDGLEDYLRDMVITLGDWRIVEWIARDDGIALHPLVREYFVGRTADSAAYHRALCGWYTALPIRKDATTLSDAGHRVLAIEHALLAGDGGIAYQLAYSPMIGKETFVDWLAVHGHLTAGSELFARIASSCDADKAAELRIARAVYLRRLGNFPAVIDDLSVVIPVLEPLVAEHPEENMASLIGALMNRGNAYRLNVQGNLALEDFNRALELTKEPWDTQDRREHLAVSILINRGNLNKDWGHLSRALDDYEIALEIYERLVPQDLRFVDETYALYLTNKGIVLTDLRHYQSAIEDIGAAIDILQRLINLGRHVLAPTLSQAQLIFASTLSQAGQWDVSLPIFDEAIEAHRNHIRNGRSELEPQLASGYVGRAIARSFLGDYEGALTDNMDALEIYERHIRLGRHDLRGYAALCMLSRSQQLLRPGKFIESNDFWRTGNELAMELVKEGELDLYVLIVRYAAGRGVRLNQMESEQRFESMDTFCGIVEHCLGVQEMPEEVWIEALEALEMVAPYFRDDLCGEERIRRFQKLKAEVADRRDTHFDSSRST